MKQKVRERKNQRGKRGVVSRIFGMLSQSYKVKMERDLEID